MTSQEQDLWFVRPRPNSLARLRLFCFPVAGGNASAFIHWPEHLPDDVDVCAIQFPGRQRRATERPYRRLSLAVQALERAISPYLDLPYAIFGTCTGSLAGFELARRLVQVKGKHPVHVFASCCRAPHMPDRDAPIHGLSEPDLWKELDRLGGTSEVVTEHPEMRALLSPLLRADFELAETYRYRQGDALECPITVYGGANDEVVSRDELEGWARHGADFDLQVLDGGHYLLDTAASELLASLDAKLTEVPSHG